MGSHLIILRRITANLVVLLMICVGSGAYAQTVELVESIPMETTLDNPDVRNTAEVWLEVIRGAKRTLDIEQFYVANVPGSSLDTVIAEIRAAARRGVHVRLLVEKSFYRKYPETVDAIGKLDHCSARVIDFHAVAGGVQHAKFFVVDGRDVFVGSQNFDWRALDHIHELGVLVRDSSSARDFLAVFDADWAVAGGEDAHTHRGLRAGAGSVSIANDDDATMRPVFSPLSTLGDSLSWDMAAILDLIDGADSTVQIQVLSYSPVDGKEYDGELEHALRCAAVRGVRVRLIVSDWSIGHKRIGYLKSLSLFPNIDVRISSIPDASTGFVAFARVEHCKYLVVDGTRAWVGTSNWSRDYFHASRNAGFVFDGGRIPTLLDRIFRRAWNSPYVSRLDVTASYTARRNDDGSGK